MKQPILFFLAMIVVIFGYVMMFTNFNTAAPEELNKVAEAGSIDECYDDTMTTWFVEFNESQEKGASMSEADASAAKTALASYDSCQQ